MSIIAYIESSNREPKKSAFEVISYAKNNAKIEKVEKFSIFTHDTSNEDIDGELISLNLIAKK